MAEITRVYTQHFPASKFVGKRYHDCDRENNVFACKWAQWFREDWFTPLLVPGQCGGDSDNAFYGLCREKEGEDFEYWIGVFLPEDAPVPAGYESLPFPACTLGVCWIYGKEPDIYCYCCLSRLKEEGLTWAADENGVRWCFERYVNPRFTTPDDKGNIILDMCYVVNEKKR